MSSVVICTSTTATTPRFTAFLQRYVEIRPGDVLFDIGANIGWYSLVFDRLAPDGADIYAFEPEPENFALLEANIARNEATHVHAVCKGVSDRAETRALYLCPRGNRGRHSLLPINEGGTVDVPVVSLDEFWAERDLGDRVVRLLKIDIEGHEYSAFRGAGAVLGRCRSILAEYAPAYMRKSGIEPASVLQLLSGNGFKPALIEDGKKIAIDLAALAAVERAVDVLWERAD
ncbi:hypothetical protein BH24PSE2_BH24PSE2_13670 [soil metagenome]